MLPVARRQTGAYVWLGLNLAISALSVVCGAIVGMAVGGHQLAVALGFMLGYGLANFGLVVLVDAYSEGQVWTDNVLSALRLGAQSYLLFAAMVLVVGALAINDLIFVLPLTFVPIWALRTALDYQAKMYDHYYETILALSLMLQRAHPYTHGHLERVARVAEQVALKLGLAAGRARLVREAAVLHDIGKIAVSETILDKPGRLTTDEFEHVKRHAALGAKILRPVGQFNQMAPWIRHHHERLDGTGYPDRLTDVEIPIESKIIAVVDAFDAMTGGENAAEKRTYREPKTHAEAVAELERCSGTQFDPSVVEAFKSVLFTEGLIWTR
jgi:putative nucleotidyltransferase with HDIG domain